MNSIAIIKKIFLILMYPRYWITMEKYPYCKEFDEWVIKKLKEGEIPEYLEGCDCRVKFGGRILWKWRVLSASDFSLYEDGCDTVRASRLANIKLYRLLKGTKVKKELVWEKK